MIPKPTQNIDEKVQSLESKLTQIEEILKSAKPIKSIYHKTGPFWLRYYSTDDGFLKYHIKDLKFTDEGSIGFAIMKDPKNIFKKDK